jgi:hypothetical protein
MEGTMYESLEARLAAAEKRAKRTTLAVPKGAISFIVSRLHVGTSDAEVEANITKRTAKLTPAQQRKCVAYALRCHHENRGLYNRVMGGH